MLTYYPPIQPYAVHQLAVDPPHQLYIEECGNPNGLPILVVHGGPGSGCSEDSRRYFDPNIYRIILFDQRGAGRSTPSGELSGNNTQTLIKDMEAIRELLQLERWILYGGSWGSTLSLIYAQTYPDRVMALILRGIFLATQHELEWLYAGKGAREIFPDYWEEFISPIPEGYRHSPIPFYYDILTGSNEIARLSAAKIWASWEARIAKLEFDKRLLEQMTTTRTALSMATIECHYFMNNCFLEPNQIMRNMNKIQHIYGIIVHGRYDIVCSLSNAWDLQKAWPNSELHIVRNAGHSGSEPGIMDGIIRATRMIAKRFH